MPPTSFSKWSGIDPALELPDIDLSRILGGCGDLADAASCLSDCGDCDWLRTRRGKGKDEQEIYLPPHSRV